MKYSILLALLIPTILICQQPLFIPDTLSGSEMDLILSEGQVDLYEGSTTNTIGYNQDILGPTLILNKGSDVTLNVTNNLTELTTLHWHGLHVSPENDGGPHTIIEAGQTWSPSFTVLNDAATYWYHPHLHEHTEEQVTSGAAGLIIVRDEVESLLYLPRTYGIDDIPLVIQSRAFDGNNQLMDKTASDDIIMVNATLNAFLELPAQIVRFRLLNGSTERNYNLGFTGNIDFYQIASDGGLLDAPVLSQRLRLAPGERAEILIDLSALKGQSIQLMSFASELPTGYYGAQNPSVMPIGSIDGYADNPLNGSNFNILKMDITEPTAQAIESIPEVLITNTPHSISDVNATRNLSFRPLQMGPFGMLNGPFAINGRSFDLEFINYEIPLDNTEIWQIFNMTAIAHPFHIHDVQFYLLDINGAPPPPHLAGKKDVVLVPPMGGSIRFITKFEDFANAEVPYMFHCHMLSHEDAGMMGQFLVTGQTTSIKHVKNSNISIYPNPVHHVLTVEANHLSTIRIYNISGLLIEKRYANDEIEKIIMADYTPGVYFLKITSMDSTQAVKIVKN